MDLSKVDNIEFADINMSDYPDFSDAYASSADYDGREMTEEEIDELNEKHREFVYQKIFEHVCT